VLVFSGNHIKEEQSLKTKLLKKKIAAKVLIRRFRNRNFLTFRFFLKFWARKFTSNLGNVLFRGINMVYNLPGRVVVVVFKR
jgi:hypothetical protein